jgi:type IV secretion system protein VirD4
MKRFLNTLSIIFSWLGTIFPKTDTLHHARFALPHELKSLLTHTFNQTSLLIGISHLGGIYRVKPTKDRQELGHALIVAPTRGGKSLLAMSQLLGGWEDGSVIVNDIKGELFRKTAGYRSTLGPVYVIDPQGYGHRYDPLHGCSDEDSLYDAANNLLFEPKEGDSKSFTERGTKLLTLVWCAALEFNRLTQAKHRLLPFLRHMADLGLNSAAPVIHAISPLLARRLLDGEYNPDIDYEERKFLANSWESLTARLYPLLTEKLVRCFNGSDFTGKDIIAGPKPVTVYLCWPESTLLAKTALIRLVLESLNTEMKQTYDGREGAGCRRVLLLLDEAGIITLPNLPHDIATLAGRGISVWAAIQDLGQLEVYGHNKARTIRNNCDTKIFYHQASLETAEYVERFLGRRSGYAHSQTLHDGEEASEGLSEQGVPLLTSRDINELDLDEIIAFYLNKKPLYARRMDWRAFC